MRSSSTIRILSTLILAVLKGSTGRAAAQVRRLLHCFNLNCVDETPRRKMTHKWDKKYPSATLIHDGNSAVSTKIATDSMRTHADDSALRFLLKHSPKQHRA